MTRIFTGCLSLGFLLMLNLPLHAEDARFNLKSEKLDLPADVSDEVKKLLDPQAFIITPRGAEPSIRLWFRKAIPARANEDQIKNGLTYREIPEGTLLAVIEFVKPFVDFRKQEIPAGIYTLRLGVQPDIGDHKDTAPHPDFALLAPVKLDTKADEIEVKDLIKLSRKATGGDHPGVMLLFPYYGDDAAAKIVGKDGDIQTLQLRRSLSIPDQKVTLGFALVIHGISSKR